MNPPDPQSTPSPKPKRKLVPPAAPKRKKSKTVDKTSQQAAVTARSLRFDSDDEDDEE